MTDAVSVARDGWLVAVDMQRIFADPASPWATPGFVNILGPIRELMAAYDDRVAFTRFVAPKRPSGSWVPYYDRWQFAMVPDDDPLYDIVDALPSEGRPIVTRPTFGKYDDGPDGIPDATDNAETLILVGVSTDCCVLSTALAAADAGVFVVVAADACAGVSDADHDRALDTMRLYAPHITIATTAEILASR